MKKVFSAALALLLPAVLLAGCEDNDWWGHHDHDHDRDRDREQHLSAVHPGAAIAPAPVTREAGGAGS